jgi:uncharacterized RDD family membrane protein YckC
MPNPYAPPRAAVRDVVVPTDKLVLAERGTRLGADILDTIIGVGMSFGPAFVFGIVGTAAAASPDASRGTGIMTLGLVLSLVGLLAWLGLTFRFLSLNGQSIGKKIVGIKIVRKDGTRASLGRIFFLRNLVIRAVSLIPMFTFVDALFVFSESRQCLHDRLADTIVVVA